MHTRPPVPPPGLAANHTAVVRHARLVARHSAVGAFCFAWGAWGLSSAAAAATWILVATVMARAAWQSRHRLVVDDYASIERHHQLTRALGGDR